MTIISNSTELVNAINSNASLTVTNDGQIKKQGLLGSIFQKIGDFFSSQSKIEQRQAKLEDAMIKLLNDDAEGESIADLSELTDNKLAKYSSRIKIETAKINAYAKTAEANEEIAKFSREFITNTMTNITEELAKIKDKDDKEAYINQEIAKMNGRLDHILKFKTTNEISKNEMSQLNNILKTRYQSYIKDRMSEEGFKTNPKTKETTGPKVCAQFKGDISRQTTIIDGKKFSGNDGLRAEEQLTKMFENPKTSYFISWCLNQTMFTDPSTILITPDAFEVDNNIQLPQDLIGGRPANDPDKVDDSIFFKMNSDSSKLSYELKTVKQGNKIIGAEIKAVGYSGIRDIDSEKNLLLAQVRNTVTMKIDLKDPNNPKITSYDTKFTVPGVKKKKVANVNNNGVTNNNISANRNEFMKELSTKLSKSNKKS